MNKLFWRVLFFLATFLYSIYASSQPAKSKDCGTTCFSSKVVTIEDISPACRLYEVQVSFSGECGHALSHYSVAVPCGEVRDIWNSQNWKQVIGTDPATGLAGFKIDDIPGFGETSVSSFTVRFTVCSSNEECANDLKCWQPLVAYKASTCVNFETVEVQCKSLKASLARQDVSCFGADDGSLTVVVEDGQEPFSYSWSNSHSGQSLSGLAAGNYSVIVKDAAGFEVTLEETITQPERLVIEGAVTAASCNGVADGAVDLSVSGGTAPYTVTWSTGLTSEDIQNLSAGKYLATVQEATGCSATASFTVANTSLIELDVSLVKPDCNDVNGSIDLTATGGASPYTFRWSNGSVTEDITNAGAGIYTVIVSDNAGCSAQKTVLLKENNTLSLRGVPTSTSCTGEATGSIDLSVSGGTVPYSFSWSTGETTEDISALTSGTYTVKVVDGKGCSVTATFSVTKTTFQVPRTINQTSCYGEQDGSITLHDPIGGTGPFTYEWSNGAAGTSLSGLASGSYSVIITDATGCSRTYSFTLGSPAEIMASATVSTATCDEGGAYTIDLNVSGGTAPYSYFWSVGAPDEDIQVIAPGTYTVIVTDANGCMITKDVLVEEKLPPVACMIEALATMPMCGTTGNTLSASVVDADSYLWAVVSSDGGWSITSGDAATITFISGLANSSATFTLTITKNGCSTTCSYVVSACTPQDHTGEEGEGEDPDGEQPGGGEPGGETPGEDIKQNCDNCLSTSATLIASSDMCRTYEMKVSTNGLCQHELSHWTLSLPCVIVTNAWNSAGWPMTSGLDPTTGLYGLKVDDIGAFGHEADYFIVRFTICETSCDLASWNPQVAYKAGQCVGTEEIGINLSESFNAAVAVYPNPFTDIIHFEWRAMQTEMNLEIIDQYGNAVMHSTRPTGKAETFYLNIESSALPKGMYYYRLTVDGKTYNGKITKR